MAPTRVLIVDDDELTHELIRSVFGGMGWQVKAASNGVEGLRVAEDWPPDVFIVDVNMPLMDGFAMVRHLRSRPQLTMIPVVFLTSRSSAQDRLTGYELGADDYLPKPVRIQELQVRVANTLRRIAVIKDSVSASLSAAERGSTILSGSLDQLSLPSVLTLLELEHKSGFLDLSHVDGSEEATLVLRNGAVIQAYVDGPEPLRNRAAICRVLMWPGGSFRFCSEPTEAADEIQTPTATLLLDTVRLIDEASAGGFDL